MKVDIANPSANPEFEDIRSCLINIASIPRGSIPLARGMGLSWASLSEVPEDLENDYAVDAVEQYGEYEPRVAISEVAFEHDQRERQTVATLTFEGSEEDEENE